MIITLIFALFVTCIPVQAKRNVCFESEPQFISEKTEISNKSYNEFVLTKVDTETEKTNAVNDKEVLFEVPLYNQGNYPNTPYGDYGTIASHGCGITCLSMITSYFKDEEVLPDVLAEQFGEYNTKNGSYWILFEDSAKELELPHQERTYDWDKVYEALKNGQIVVSLQKGNSLFTKGGHFVLLTGISEDGLIFVNDPNGKNYEKESLKNGFENGFTAKQIRKGEVVYWIYSAKEFETNIASL